jgi:DNA modification methylase
MIGKSKTTKVKYDTKRKELLMIPARLAIALSKDGWYMRQDIIWHKPNPMPESVKDRCTKSYEHIFLLAKSPKYYFNAEAISEDVAESTIKRMNQDIKNQKGSYRQPGKTNGPMKACAPRYRGNKYTKDPETFYRTKSGDIYKYKPKRNKRDVWTISTRPYKGAHFATFPIELPETCLLAGCPNGGIAIDIFMGSGTTGVAAKKLNLDFIGIELNEKYCEMAKKRIKGYL